MQSALYLLAATLFIFLYLAPVFFIWVSPRSHGGETFGWVLLSLWMPVVGFAIFLILTQKRADKHIAEHSHLDSIQNAYDDLTVRARADIEARRKAKRMRLADSESRNTTPSAETTASPTRASHDAPQTGNA